MAPAHDVMPKFRAGKLRSGSKSGPRVTDPKQARAILLSEARDEGHDIPMKSSYRKRGRKRAAAGGKGGGGKRS